MTEQPHAEDARRPLASRQTGLARGALGLLLKTSITPNQISLLSMVAAGMGAAALVLAPDRPWLYLLAAVGVQLRLLCNLLDGMVAVEGGRGSAVGGLYNEVPDRVADSLFFIAWGYATGFGWAGWLLALAAMATAYIRLLGGAHGLKQSFRGPLAKQHRMASLTVICLAALIEAWWLGSRYALTAGLFMTMAGTWVTCWKRLAAIAAHLRAG